MKPTLLTSPDVILRQAKVLFATKGVRSFHEEGANYFAFGISDQDYQLVVRAEVEPELNRFYLATRLFDSHGRSAADCQELAAKLNGFARYSNVVLTGEAHPGFVLESILLLADGTCLDRQIDFLCDMHLSSVAILMPLIAQFARQETNLESLMVELRITRTAHDDQLSLKAGRDLPASFKRQHGRN